jgi:exopolyphosphatase/guanosine-5'-triphosphate,3'-diphosphate pyrophosphatase
MKIAIIDMGTNTFNLLIAEPIQDGKFKKIYSDRVAVKLGEGSINQGFISPIPYQRGLDAMISYHNKIKEYDVTHVKAIATAAIRSATNGQQFTQEVKAFTGIDVEVIQGDREAELIFKGAKHADSTHGKDSLIMDIGGGSTEFMIVKNSELVWKKSYPLGAALLLQKFNPENPIEKNTLLKITSHLQQSLYELINNIITHQPKTLIGTSGAFDSFVDMLSAVHDTKAICDEQNSYEINLNQFFDLYNNVISSTQDERKAMKGLIPMRIDMIVLSFILAKYIIDISSVKQFFCCTYSLKEGALIEIIHANKHL